MKALINIWMLPVYVRLNMDSRRSLYLLLALFPIGGQLIAGAIFFSKGAEAKLSVFPIAFLLSLAAGVAMLVFAWFLFLVMNVGMQYSPANAALVPGLKRRLQMALALPIVVISTLAVVIVSFAARKFTMFPAFVCILFFAYFLGVMRSQWLVIPAVISSQIPLFLMKNKLFDADTIDLLKNGLAFEIVLLLASVLLLWGVLHWFFALRDEAHFKMHKRSLAMRQGMNSREVPINQLAARFNSPFLTWMQMGIRRSQVSTNAVARLALAPFALGPRLHWTTLFVQLFLMIAAGVLMVLLMGAISGFKNKEFTSGFSLGFPAVMLIGFPLFFCGSSFFALYQTRTEQALFSLTPAVTDQRDMDRVLAHYMLRQFLILLSASVFCSLLLVQFAKEFPLTGELLSLGSSCLFVLVLAMTHPYGKMKAATDHPLMKLGLIAAVLLVFGIVMTIWVSNQIAWWLSAAIVIVTSVISMLRLQRNARTVQFPVGRAVS